MGQSANNVHVELADWFDYHVENDPRFAKRMEFARASLRAGKGIRIKTSSLSRSGQWWRDIHYRSTRSRQPIVETTLLASRCVGKPSFSALSCAMSTFYTNVPDGPTYVPPATAGGACSTTTKSTPIPLALTSSFTFDTVGNVHTIDGPIAGTVDTTTYLFDSARRLTTVSAPLSALTRYCYDADGQLVSTNRARSATADPNATTASGLTSSGQCPANSYPTATWQTESRTYFAPGYLRSVTDAQANTTLYGYGVDGRQQVVQDPDGRQVATVYDLAGETLATWKGGLSWITTDGNQNPSAAALALANTTWIPSSYLGGGPLRYASYLYSLNGKQISIQDADNNTTQLQYDGLDRLRLTLFPDPAAGTRCSFNVSPTSYYDSGAPTCSVNQTYELSTYDANGNRLGLWTRKGDAMGYHFDALNREDIKTPAGLGAVTTGFNLLGEPLLVSEAAGGSHGAHTTQYAYDGNGRKLSETNDSRQVSYTYDTLGAFDDNAGNRTRTTWRMGTMSPTSTML